MFALSIKTKVSLVAAAAFVALSTIAIFVFNSLTQNSQVTTSIQKNYYPSLQVASVNGILISQAAEQFNVAVTLGDIEMVNQTMRLESKITQGLDQLVALNESGDNAKVQALKDAVSQYFAVAYKVASGIIGGDTANMSEYGRLATENNQALQGLVGSFKDLYDEQKTIFDSAVSVLETDNNDTKTMVTIISISSLILIIAMGVMIVAGIKKDLAKISSKMHDIATGDGDLTVRLKHDKHDELKGLVDDFNLFVDKLNTNISDIVSDINSLKGISHHLQTANNNTQQLSKAQLTSVEESAAAISQMSDVAKEIASNAVNTASAVENALIQSKQSSAFVQETINGFRQLVVDIKGASDVVTELDNSTKNAESILDTINSIAEQTNLLALNAAIEAARAGEQGRGFAVVADEVRTLASRTQSSTQEIQAVLEQLQVQANTAKEIIANSVVSAELCSAKSNDAEVAINQVSDNVNNVQQRNELVAAATEQQGNTARQIEENLIHIRDMSQQTSDSVDMVVTVAQQVEVIEKNLTNITSQFKYDNVANK